MVWLKIAVWVCMLGGLGVGAIWWVDGSTTGWRQAELIRVAMEVWSDYE